MDCKSGLQGGHFSTLWSMRNEVWHYISEKNDCKNVKVIPEKGAILLTSLSNIGIHPVVYAVHAMGTNATNADAVFWAVTVKLQDSIHVQLWFDVLQDSVVLCLSLFSLGKGPEMLVDHCCCRAQRKESNCRDSWSVHKTAYNPKRQFRSTEIRLRDKVQQAKIRMGSTEQLNTENNYKEWIPVYAIVCTAKSGRFICCCLKVEFAGFS